MSRPRVSVVMGVRDAAAVLPRALRSLAAQTFGDWECVVVDDGSKDVSARIAASFRRVRVLTQRASGLSEALRLGCEEARGSLIARLDADDEALPERLARQVAAFDADSGLVALGCGVELRAESGASMGRRSYPSGHEAIVDEMGALRAPIPHSTLMARPGAIAAVGGYRPEFRKAQDYDLLLRLAEVGRLSNLSDALVVLTLSAESMTTSPDGGEQLEFGAMALACAAIREESGEDPLAGRDRERFREDFKSWYAGSRLPGVFRSRLAGRELRTALAESRPLAAAAALVNVFRNDPYRFLPGSMGDRRAADAVRGWALAWSRRRR